MGAALEQQPQELEAEQDALPGHGAAAGGCAQQLGRRYHINDNADLLAEILARLDGRSLAAAAGVCRLWAAAARRDAVWEALCLRHLGGPAAAPATRAVVSALGGYRRLYRLCLGPALDRLGRAGGGALAHWPGHAPARAHLSLSLSLSLFSIDCYERLGAGGGRQPPTSLLFLCKPVDVS